MKALFALFAVSVSTAAVAADADLLRCRALADASAKLACYDAIPVAAAAAPSARPAAAAATAAATAATTTATATAAATVTGAAPAMPRATAATATAREATFGLSASQLRKADDKDSKAGEDGVHSTLVGAFSGWGPGTTFRLANGQAWRVADDSSASLNPREAPRVTITRNFIGTYFLEVDGVKQAPRVRRTD